MVSISLSDLQLLDEFKTLPESEMILIKNDEAINKVLYTIGFDVPRFGVIYIPSKHRNLQNKVVIGYRVVGDVRRDDAFKNGPMASLTDRLTISAYKDVSLMKEMALLSGLSRNTMAGLEDDLPDDQETLPESQLEPGWKELEQRIQRMVDLRDKLRGPYLNDAGNLKTQSEYAEWLLKQTK